MKKNNLILILARGGNERIARLNLRLIDGKPLLFYILQTALQVKIGDVYVSTDSEEIKQLTLLYGGKVISRPKKLTRDSTTSEEIIMHALSKLEKNSLFYNKCFIVSPIFPLLKIATIKKFFNKISNTNPFINGFINYHNTYGKYVNDNKIVKVKDNLRVTKKIFGINITDFKKLKKIPKNLYGIELSKEEGIVISDYHDLSTVEKIIQRKKILVRVDGNTNIGLGHIYNMLTVLNYLRDNEILIVMNNKKKLGDYKFQQQNYKIKYFSNDVQLWEIIKKFQPNIIFNDILDTTPKYVKKLRENTDFIVNFEDLGKGSNYVDLVFNPIYDSRKTYENKFFGSKYACVRDEFRLWKTHKVRKKVEKVLITFGGTDPTNVTIKILKVLSKSKFFNIEFVVILGIGNSHRKEISKFVKEMNENGFSITIIQRSDIMAKHIVDSDFVITSNGRTIFEVASVNVPMIVIPVNQREKKHSFANYSCGTIYLQNFSEKKTDLMLNKINKIMKYKTRKELVKNLEKFNLLEGVYEIINIINKRYR